MRLINEAEIECHGGIAIRRGLATTSPTRRTRQDNSERIPLSLRFANAEADDIGLAHSLQLLRQSKQSRLICVGASTIPSPDRSFDVGSKPTCFTR